MQQHREEGSLVRGQVVHLHSDHLLQVLMLGLSDFIFFFFGRGWDKALSKEGGRAWMPEAMVS